MSELYDQLVLNQGRHDLSVASAHAIGSYLAQYAAGTITQKQMLNDFRMTGKARRQLMTLMSKALNSADPDSYAQDIENHVIREQTPGRVGRKKFNRALGI